MEVLQKLGIVISTILIAFTSLFTGNKVISSPTPIPISNQELKLPLISTPSTSPKIKNVATPKPTNTSKPEEITCSREEVISEMEKAGITVSEEQIVRNQSSCNLDKQREWSVKNTIPLQGSQNN